VNSGDTAWTLVSAVLVFLMTPGLAFFYGGLVQERSAINTIKMSFVALGLVTVTWALAGYSLAFSEGNAWIGGVAYLGLSGVGAEPTAAGNIPHLVFMMFQMMFAIITPALISGALVGRMKFKAYAMFIVAWSLLVYAPLCHWVWGPGGWIAALGAIDFAGGTVVHVSAGVAALVAAVILGPRRPSVEERPHNVPLVVLGASLLWFGWFGFNAGSALAADGLAALAAVTTMLAAASAAVTWIAVQGLRNEKPTAVGASIGAVVGLVAITPAAGFVAPMSALAIGAIASVISYLVMARLRRTRLDDTLDVFACHGVGGVVGALLTGVFATTAVNPGGADGLLAGNASLLIAQAAGVLAAAALSATGTTAILLLLRRSVGLRPAPDAEEQGIDWSEHSEIAYCLDRLPTATNGTAAPELDPVWG
jgi:Amt family ammonium transporter